ncbi:MAG TPA: 3-deoxy-D-manno-octulosonic acid kinase [Steroidobacteraceae bacterium]|nr:3-deoxy-D-manno-octulosonic acid kinase [Steroidobacteraceae bacterium]
MLEQRVAIEGGAILAEASESGNAATAWFFAHPAFDSIAAEAGQVSVTKGRGGAFFVDVAGHRWVTRPYRRGGFIANFSRNRYLWTGEERVRSFREWRTLAALSALGLPVPKPVAARYRRLGWTYRADLITERLEATEPLSARLEIEPLSLTLWIETGRVLRRLQDAGAYHADLNAHNILIDSSNRVFVVDFDRGSIRRPGPWRDANLARLYRSLRKVSAPLAPDRFGNTEWETLLAGYRSLPAAAGAAPGPA